MAFLVPAHGLDLSEDDVMAHCRERLAAYKSPVRIILTDGLPKTGSGKVKKDALRRLACISADGVS